MSTTTRRPRGEERAEPLARHRERLLARIRALLGERARRRLESGDVLQGVALEWARLPESRRPRGTYSVLRWGTAVARNDVRDALRKRAPDSEPPAEPLDTQDPSPATRVEEQEELDHLADAIADLPENHRRVIELRDLSGLSFHDVGVELGCTEAAAQMLHTRALARLGRRLRREEP